MSGRRPPFPTTGASPNSQLSTRPGGASHARTGEVRRPYFHARSQTSPSSPLRPPRPTIPKPVRHRGRGRGRGRGFRGRGQARERRGGGHARAAEAAGRSRGGQSSQYATSLSSSSPFLARPRPRPQTRPPSGRHRPIHAVPTATLSSSSSSTSQATQQQQQRAHQHQEQRQQQRHYRHRQQPEEEQQRTSATTNRQQRELEAKIRMLTGALKKSTIEKKNLEAAVQRERRFAEGFRGDIQEAREAAEACRRGKDAAEAKASRETQSCLGLTIEVAELRQSLERQVSEARESEQVWQKRIAQLKVRLSAERSKAAGLQSDLRRFRAQQTQSQIRRGGGEEEEEDDQRGGGRWRGGGRGLRGGMRGRGRGRGGRGGGGRQMQELRAQIGSVGKQRDAFQVDNKRLNESLRKLGRKMKELRKTNSELMELCRGLDEQKQKLESDYHVLAMRNMQLQGLADEAVVRPSQQKPTAPAREEQEATDSEEVRRLNETVAGLQGEKDLLQKKTSALATKLQNEVRLRQKSEIVLEQCRKRLGEVQRKVEDLAGVAAGVPLLEKSMDEERTAHTRTKEDLLRLKAEMTLRQEEKTRSLSLLIDELKAESLRKTESVSDLQRQIESLVEQKKLHLRSETVVRQLTTQVDALQGDLESTRRLLEEEREGVSQLRHLLREAESERDSQKESLEELKKMVAEQQQKKEEEEVVAAKSPTVVFAGDDDSQALYLAIQEGRYYDAHRIVLSLPVDFDLAQNDFALLRTPENSEAVVVALLQHESFARCDAPLSLKRELLGKGIQKNWGNVVSELLKDDRELFLVEESESALELLLRNQKLWRKVLSFREDGCLTTQMLERMPRVLQAAVESDRVALLEVILREHQEPPTVSSLVDDEAFLKWAMSNRRRSTVEALLSHIRIDPSEEVEIVLRLIQQVTANWRSSWGQFQVEFVAELLGRSCRAFLREGVFTNVCKTGNASLIMTFVDHEKQFEGVFRFDELDGSPFIAWTSSRPNSANRQALEVMEVFAEKGCCPPVSSSSVPSFLSSLDDDEDDLELEGESEEEEEENGVTPAKVAIAKKFIRDRCRMNVQKVETRNVLLCGASRSGKTTCLRVLADATAAPDRISIFSQTVHASLHSLVLNPSSEDQTPFTVNLVDTPGLFESVRIGERARTMDELVRAISACLQFELTHLHCVLVFVPVAGGIKSEAVESLKVLVEMFRGTSVRFGLVVPYAETMREKEREHLKQQFAQHPDLAPLIADHSFSVLFTGCIDPFLSRYSGRAGLLSAYKRVERLRRSILRFFFASQGRAQLAEMPFVKNRYDTTHSKLKELISIYQLVVRPEFDAEDPDTREMLRKARRLISVLQSSRGFLVGGGFEEEIKTLASLYAWIEELELPKDVMEALRLF